MKVATLLGQWPSLVKQEKVSKLRPELNGVTGPMVEVFHDTVKEAFDPPPAIKLSTSWATTDSRAAVKTILNVSSSYTACVWDVTVGNYDVCVADLWHTRERELMTTFLPFLYLDELVLVMPVEETPSPDLLGYMEKPFLPFTWEAWGWMAALLVFSAMAAYVTDSWEEDGSEDFPYPPTGYRLIRAGRALYIMFLGFFEQSPELTSPTFPSKIVKFGFAFFVLITISSYTANLATMLVTSAYKQKNQQS